MKKKNLPKKMTLNNIDEITLVRRYIKNKKKWWWCLTKKMKNLPVKSWDDNEENKRKIDTKKKKKKKEKERNKKEREMWFEPVKYLVPGPRVTLFTSENKCAPAGFPLLFPQTLSTRSALHAYQTIPLFFYFPGNLTPSIFSSPIHPSYISSFPAISRC